MVQSYFDDIIELVRSQEKAIIEGKKSIFAAIT